MNTVITQNNQKVTNLKAKVNAIAFHIQFILQIRQGGELTSALGYQDLSTNDAAIKNWVSDHLEGYLGLEHMEMVQMMAEDINNKISNYFGGYGLNTYH